MYQTFVSLKHQCCRKLKLKPREDQDINTFNLLLETIIKTRHMIIYLNTKLVLLQVAMQLVSQQASPQIEWVQFRVRTELKHFNRTMRTGLQRRNSSNANCQPLKTKMSVSENQFILLCEVKVIIWTQLMFQHLGGKATAW